MEFTEVGGGDEEKEEVSRKSLIQQDDEEEIDERFKDIDDEKLSDICIGNYKEYIETEEISFETLNSAIKSGISKAKILFGFLFKLFDLDASLVDKFKPFLNHVLSKSFNI